MAKINVYAFSDDDRLQLQHLSDLLHLFNHRNKNQHRRSIWWRHFSVFRRQLNHLVEDLTTLNEKPTTHLERTRKKAKDEAARSSTSQRLTLWQDQLVPKWQHSFSQVVTEGRFAVLGVVLLAVLAQTCQIAGVTADLEDIGQLEVEKVLHDFGEEYWATETEPSDVRNQEAEDVGEVVARDQESFTAESETPPVPEAMALPHDSAGSPVETRKKRQRGSDTSAPKRKRNKGNAIDDLFSGLD